jgi:hypothetical protein
LNEVFPGLWRKWFLKLQNSSRERLRQNTPPPFAEPPFGAQDHSLIYRRMAQEGKEMLCASCKLASTLAPVIK